MENTNPQIATLTVAQGRYYDAIVATGEKCYNGRAMRVIDRLVALGLVVADYDLIIHGAGGPAAHWRITVRPNSR